MKTRTDKGVSHQRGSANVYADLGYKSADEMLVKAQLVTAIAEILAERGYTQTKAAALLGIPQPKLSKMLRGQFRGFSERKLMDCLTLLGRDIDIVVRTTSKRKGQGAVSVSFA
jgi:predicted XRE-type DNA-binding protein